MDYVTFYNQSGQSIAWVADDNQSIYLFNGTPVAWLSEDSIYSYSGRVRGDLREKPRRRLNSTLGGQT